MTKSDDPICVMCEKTPVAVNLQGEKLINALLCWGCANKLHNLIDHCELDWSFTLGINPDLHLVTQKYKKGE